MMPRFLIIPSLCLWLVGCDKQSETLAETQEVTTNSSSSRRGLTATDERMDPSAKSPQDLLAEAETLEPTEREKALAAIAWNTIETDSKIAHEAFGKMSPGSLEKIRLIQHYAMRLAEQNIDEAIAWAEALENETEKSAALSHIAIALAETDPQRAAHWLTEADIPGRDFEVAVVQVIQRWAAKSPAEAAAWVSQFPQNPARDAGVKFISERWLPSDAPAAFAWLSSMKNAELRQETARAMEGIILQQSEETRAAWLQHANEAIQKELEQQRENALKDVGNNVPTSAPEINK
jgi:hypothetical protein